MLCTQLHDSLIVWAWIEDMTGKLFSPEDNFLLHIMTRHLSVTAHVQMDVHHHCTTTVMFTFP